MRKPNSLKKFVFCDNKSESLLQFLQSVTEEELNCMKNSVENGKDVNRKNSIGGM